MSTTDYEEIWEKILELRSKYITTSTSGDQIPRVLLTKPDADYIYTKLYPFVGKYKADDPRLPGEVEKLLEQSRENSIVLYLNSEYEIEVYCGTKQDIGQSVKKESSGCFIATAVYGSPMAREVVILQSFRDELISKTRMGRLFIAGYYRFSPPLTQLISRSATIKKVIRKTLVSPLVPIADRLLGREMED